MIMKRFLLTILCSLFMFVSYAQSSQIAVLSHNGTASVFYGAAALCDAHAAASHGDAITLSAGYFKSVDITKAITLRGASMELDTVQNIEPTIITGRFNIAIPDTVSQRLVIEAIYSNDEINIKGRLTNALFNKCRFSRLSNNLGVMNNVNFVHCLVTEDLNFTTGSVSCINSVIARPHGNCSYFFNNCVVRDEVVNDSYFKNCIIYLTFSNGDLGSDNMAFNCVGLGERPNMFDDVPNATNIISTCAEVFKTYTGEIFEKLECKNFELTDAAKAKFLGTDGKEVGIYGGTFPFSSTPTNPQITKCNVASKSTIDGKLSVDIEVKVVE